MSLRDRLSLATLALLALAAGAHAAAPPAPVAFTDVHLVPMDRERILENVTVLIRDGRVTQIGETGYIDIPEGARVVEGRGRYLLPGLAEMHAHIPGRRSSEQWLDDVLILYLANGITTARGMLGEPAHLELRDRIARYERLGPRIYTSGPSLNGSSVDGPEDARRQVREQAAAGYDFLKLHPGLSRAEYDAIAETARDTGIPFAGHVSVDVGLARSLEAGQAAIDHLDGYLDALVPADTPLPATRGFFGSALTDLVNVRGIDALAEATREAGVWVVPTETLMENIALPTPVATLAARPGMGYVPPETLARWIETKRGVLENPDYDGDAGERFIALRKRLIRALHEAGAGILLGSDAPQVFNVPGCSIHYELEAMRAAGLSRYEVLRSGTAQPAVFFGAQGRFGTIAVGREADLILVDGNPLDDLSVLRRPEGVMARGVWLPREALDRRLAAIAGRHRDEAGDAGPPER
jgi:imidazolonepropionase-like amidohydrolase